MARNGIVNSTHKFAAVCMVSLLVATTGCVKRPGPQTGTTPPGGQTTTPGTTAPGTTETQSGLAHPVNPPFPGPYKEVEIEGVQMRQGRSPQGQFGGTLVQASIASDPKTFNVWDSNDSSSSAMGALMWPGLVTTDPYNGDVITDMAESFEVKPDHVTYITKLRKGLKWSDGKPITAEDVAFTFNEIIAKGYGNPSMRDVISVEGKVPKVTVVDELTNQFVTAKPFAPFLRTLGMPIAPKHVIEPILKGKDSQKKFHELYTPSSIDPSKLVTSGPFVLKRFVPSQRVELVRTNNYYVASPDGKRLPYLDRLVYQFVPDVNANLLKFKGGELDIAGIRNRDAVQLQKEQDKGNFKMFNLGPSTGSTFLMFNMNRRKNSKGKPYVTPYKSAWFNDVNFRQAINHAINRQRIVDGYLRGIGAPSFSAESPNGPFFNANLKPIDPDLNYSKSLLEKSGFVKKPDGLLYDSAGNKVEFDMVYGAGGTFLEAVANYIQTDLKQLGIKVNPQAVEFNSLIDRVNNAKDWQAALFGLTGDPLEPNGGANVFRTNGRLHLFDIREQNSKGDTVVTDARDWEKQLDSIFDRGAVEFDHAKRKQIYAEYQQILYDQVPFIYLVSPMNLFAVRNTVKNYNPTQLSVSQNAQGLHNIDEIWKEK